MSAPPPSSEAMPPEGAAAPAEESEKSEKQLKREAEKAKKKAEKEAKEAAKLAARAEAASTGPVTIKVGQNPPVDLEPCPGTRDFFPEDMRVREWLFGHFNEVARLCGFQNYDAPVLEMQELYKRKAGEEITQQMYAFNDKSDPPREVTLRPEMTPSLARMVLQKAQSHHLPLKWSSIPQCWRYETTTRGRKREHYQWNMDIIGVAGVEAEAEVLAAITTFFKNVGITSKDVGIKVNNRKVLQAVLEKYETPEELFAPVCVVVDKLEKLPREKIEEELQALGVSQEAMTGLLESLSLTSLDDLEKVLGSENEAFNELKQLFVLAEAYGYADWLVFDASVVRGLAYYTGTVFEAFDREGVLRAICGGGRYDKLLSAYGGDEQPMVGFGFGDAVIVELLKDRDLMPSLSSATDDIVIALGGPNMQVAATSLAAKLRAQGRSVDLVLESKKLKWAFKHADRLSAKRLFIVGEDEWAKGTVRVKDLETREESDMVVADM